MTGAEDFAKDPVIEALILDLLQWLAFDRWNGPSNQPTRLTELDDCNQGGRLLERNERPAQIVLLGHPILHWR